MERFNYKIGKIAAISLFAFLSIGLFGQEEKFLLKQGNEAYEKGEFEKADELYDKALEHTPEFEQAEFNKADVLYQQKKYAEAIEKLKTIAETTEDNELKAKSYHNMGNSFLESQQYDKSIMAYKNALKINPNDDETRYNLAYALSKLQQQQEQQKKNQNKDDKNKDKDKKDQDKKDQDKNKDKQDQDKKDQDQNKDKQDQDKKDQQQDKKDQQQDKGKQNQDQQKEQQPKPDQLSKEDAERLLNAMNNNEKDVQKKMKKKKVKANNSKTEKDW